MSVDIILTNPVYIPVDQKLFAKVTPCMKNFLYENLNWIIKFHICLKQNSSTRNFQNKILECFFASKINRNISRTDHFPFAV